MKQRFLSGFIIVALMASVIAGAMGVSLRSAKADNVAESGDKYFNEVISAVSSLGVFTQAQLDGFFGYVAPFVRDIEENSQYMVCVCHDEGTNHWAIQLFSCATIIYSYTVNAGGTYYWGLSSANGAPGSTKFRCKASLFTNGSNVNWIAWNLNISVSDYLSRNKIIDFDTVPGYQYVDWYGYPDSKNFTVSGRKFWVSHPVAAGNGTWSCSRNLFYGDVPIVSYQIKAFTLGERTYLTTLDQSLIRQLNPDLLDWKWGVYGYDENDEVLNLIFEYEHLSLIENGDDFISGTFTNVSPLGIYAVDISQYNFKEITVATFYSSDSNFNPVTEAEASNVPYILIDEITDPGTNGTSDSYTQAFTTFYNYTNTYNTTHVIPENLADTLFGLNGSKLYPCSVSVPKSVWNNNSSGASNQLSDQHNWKWWFSSRSDLGMNFELMDVVILSESSNGQYSLLYYYSDTLNNPFQYVQNLSLQDLFENFDIVILVPDDLGCLDGNTWWKNLLETICQNLGISNLSSSLLSSLAISGSDSLGVEYVNSQPSDVAGVLQGFCIVTKKAIQRQQLFVFNDGITKTYKLMSDYIENREKWEDSFLLWTASLFSQWQSLDGKLGDIYNLLYGWNLSSVLSDISESLARIANNTSEEDPGYWFLSLFNWINRFSVTDSDFATWVSDYDDFTDDLPDPGTGATVIPFPTTIPTVAVGG